jgi:GTP cyclohydrolase I
MENTLLRLRNETVNTSDENHPLSVMTMEEDDIHDHDHFSYSTETPLRQDAFEITDNEKIAGITHHFKQIMNILGMDLNDESLKETPQRVAKMYVKEVFRGLNPVYKPEVKLFPNKYQYHQMLVEKDITIYSYCEHHLVPIIGKAHIAYIPEDYVAGLSKLNRIARYFAQRPQVQERLTIQIGKELVNALKTKNVAVVIEADHLCVASRGVKDVNSSTVTSFYSGSFQDESVKNEFLRYVG